MERLKKLVKLVCELWKDDPSYPSVIVSYLLDQERWYVSIVRYAEKFGRSKYVVTSVTHPDLDAALAGVVAAVEGDSPKVLHVFQVVQHYADAEPEPFGTHIAERAPEPGEVVQLKWLDGTDAFPLKVDSVHESVIHGRAVT